MISRKLTALVSIFLMLSLLAACNLVPGQEALDSNTMLTPTATPDTLGYRAVASEACRVANWASMQTNKRQGDLIAWHPDSERIAYLAPYANTSWYIGMVTVASGTDYATRETLVPNVTATGDLTWSPEGDKLAFIASRVDEELQTVMVVNADGSGLFDLFPGDEAITDTGTSDKSILGWQDNNMLEVAVSCGVDCQQRYEIDVRDGFAAPLGDPERKNARAEINREDVKTLDGLEIKPHVIEYDPEVYPRGFSSPNWSPDEEDVLYLDRRGVLWLLHPENKTQYIIDIGLRLVSETKWSADSSQIAVRAEDSIFIFEVPCKD